jgi:bacterial/archaeal transporter family protein
MWTLLAIGSAILIGFYEVLKKHALHENAVLPVLYFSTLTGSVVFLLVNTFTHAPSQLFVDHHTHLLIILKAVLVTAVWISGFLGLKHLPISIAAPMSAAGPFFTLCGAIIILGENLSALQLAGCIVMILSMYLFSTTAKKEGVVFFKNRWIFALLFSAFLGAVSSLYDKYLVPKIGALQVQYWFAFYLPIVMTPGMLLLWLPSRKKDTFTWRWSIPCIGIFLIVADFMYFHSVMFDGALIAVIDALRRSNIIIAFIAGALIFGEHNIKEKGLALAGIVCGVLLIITGTHH